MRRSMRAPNKQDADRRTTERRGRDDRREDTVRSASGDRRVVDQRGVATSMVDALEDILKWERASERAMKIADVPSTTDVPSN
ncbi:MAG: hypothetical protein KF819_05155 [Labilithrix sp.]|nr:hypothetical protein [Labilithrix sp.]